MRKENVEVVMPHLIEGSKAWYVEYQCFNPKTGTLEKFKIYKGFKKLSEESEKRKYGKKLVNVFSKKLACGWRPWDKSQYIFRDEIQYVNVTSSFGNLKHNNSHIRKNLSMFLVETKRRITQKSYETYSSKTRLFALWLEENGYGQYRIFEITEEIMLKFFVFLIDVKKLDPVTIGKYQQILTRIFKYFQTKRIIDRIPIGIIEKPPKIKDMGARPIMDGDMTLLLKHFAKHNPQLFLASLMQFFLCCRPGNELRLLKVQDIDFYNNLVHISQANGKTGLRNVTMPQALVEICLSFKINNYPCEHYIFSQDGTPGLIPVGKNYFSRKFADYREELKLPKFYKFYSFKHTGAGKLLESGATIIEVMGHLGHTDIESTLSYVKRHFGSKSEKVLNFCPDLLQNFLKR